MVVAQRSIARFQIQSILGSTPFATTYKAFDPQRGRLVALKVLRPYCFPEPSRLASCQGEMEPLLRLQHPGMVPFLDTGVADGTLWLASEYIPFQSLNDHDLSSIPPQVVPHIIGQLAQAVDYAHSRGIVHGNIKPRNIFIVDGSRVLLAGIGLTDLARGLPTLIKATVTTPLPNYSAPEVAQGSPLTPQADVYSLGVLAYSLLTGEVPFRGVDPATVLVRQLTSMPARPTTLSPGLPAGVNDPLLRALSQRPEVRHKTATELAQELQVAFPSQGVPSLKGLSDSSAPPQQLIPGEGAQEREGTLLCPACQHPNRLPAIQCEACGSPLETPSPGTMEWVQAREEAHKAGKRRQRTFRLRVLSVLSVLVLSYSLWNTYDYFGAPVGTPVIGVAAATSDLGVVLTQEDWPTIHGDAARSGFIADPGPVPKGQLKWKFQIGAPITSAPTVVGNTVYLSTQDRRILALDASTAEVTWEVAVSGPVDSSPTIAGQFLFVGLRDGTVLALDKDTGQQRWEFDAKGLVYGSPTVHDGTLFVGSSNGRLYALDAVTGRKRWSFNTGEWITTSASVADGVVLISNADGELFLLNAGNGRQRLFHSLRVPNTETAIQGNIAYVGSDRGLLYALDLKVRHLPFERRITRAWVQLYAWDIIPARPKGRGLVWTGRMSGRASSGPAVAGDRVFIGSDRGTMHAFDTADGRKLWTFEARSSTRSAPLVAGDTLLFGTFSGRFYALDAATGDQLWTFTAEGPITSSPALAGGVLYVVSQDGSLYAIE